MNSILSNNLIYVEPSVPQIGIRNDSPNFTLDVNGTFNISGQANVNNLYCQTLNNFHWNGTQGLSGNTYGIQGYQGPSITNVSPGFQGHQGEQGFSSFISMFGNQGIIGGHVFNFTGLIGNPGRQGFQGFQGFQGAQGVQGFIGRQGRQGFQGFQGVQGAQGFRGSQGLSGNQGNQGRQGTNNLYRLTLCRNETLNLSSGVPSSVIIPWTTVASVNGGQTFNEISWSGTTITIPVTGMYLITFYSANLANLSTTYSSVTIATVNTQVTSGPSSTFGGTPLGVSLILPFRSGRTFLVILSSMTENNTVISSTFPAYLTVELI